MTDQQRETLRNLCERYHTEFREDDYKPRFDLPDGYVGGWVGGLDHGMVRELDEYGWGEWHRTGITTIYVGVDPDGRASS